MSFHFQFPWPPNNPNPNSSSTSPTNPSPPIPNPFLPIQAGLTSFLSSLPLPRPAFPTPPWARISSSASASASAASALPVAEIEERLAGVPVYALANSSQEFVLVSSSRDGGKSARGAVPPPALGLLCFRKEDADALLAQMDGDMAAGSTVVPVALNKVIQLKSDGVAFRFVPDSSQVANAMKLMENEGDVNVGFQGVPVFQSRSLVLMSDNKRYRPVFFRKEDLDNSLHRASRDQQKPNPAVKMGDIQVSSLENIIKSMKDSSSSKWDDAVFIPPGFDLATGAKQSNGS
uniref:Tic22-like family protein n=1 Tax=Leersia perrieri TaxID=77586 RepID=A0A0D9WXS0_9ORYZ